MERRIPIRLTNNSVELVTQSAARRLQYSGVDRWFWKPLPFTTLTFATDAAPTFCAVPMMESRDGTGQKEGIFGRGDGQENRRLGAFPFRFLDRPREKPAECAQQCAQTGVPK